MSVEFRVEGDYQDVTTQNIEQSIENSLDRDEE